MMTEIGVTPSKLHSIGAIIEFTVARHMSKRTSWPRAKGIAPTTSHAQVSGKKRG